ncbi:hypothetical protein thalar_03032 [Litoreibacter arenae DSM 19593]|uniref:Uncharacterized protein n=1 Tax=Litoreibacter arenae DSM 19593 TaxID=1123360 RepID=S9RGU4_9RHOB|nr:hypothetical protein thalar_03032 [Litoreibacter arenae DSM 19593]
MNGINHGSRLSGQGKKGNSGHPCRPPKSGPCPERAPQAAPSTPDRGGSIEPAWKNDVLTQ